MVRKLLIRSAALLSILVATQARAQSPTSQALGFNVFVQNGATLNNNETEGPVAMGGNLTIAGGYQVSTNYTGTYTVGGVHVTLLVGGKVIYSSGSLTVDMNGYVKIGDSTGSHAWYLDMSGAASPMRVTPGTDYNGSPRINMQVHSTDIGVSATSNPMFQSGLINFATAFTQMKAKSTCMSGLTDNAYLTNSGGTVIPHTGLPSQVKITLNSGINVLNVTGADLNNVTTFTYNNNPDASHVLIVNVNGGSTFSWSVYNSGGIGGSQCPYILYNFYNTTTLNIVGGGAVEGTVYAPYADITKTVNAANIEGQIIAQSYNHAGGENHYFPFTPSITGCGDTLATTAAFTTNVTNQCISTNSFVFTDASTGTSPFTYKWSFGDGTTSTATGPTKSYTAVGTYTVKEVVTGAGGKDSTTHTVTVSNPPSYGFTSSDTLMSLTGNHFTFTSNTPTTGNTYAWSFGDGTTSTSVNPTKSYTAAGSYSVRQIVTSAGGCMDTAYKTIVVASDGVGGGTTGGLESQSLGGRVAQRDFNNAKNSVNTKFDYSKAQPFIPHHTAGTNAKTTSASAIQSFVPANLDSSTASLVTTPADITTLTAAVDVFSVDYVNNNNAKGVVLGITTLAKPYSHTKSICDRFRGATLMNTNTVNIQGFDFIQFQMRQTNGDVEYCIAFAAGKSAGSTKFNLQNKWLITEYTGDDSVFNFQAWAATPGNNIKLVNDILNNLKSVMPLQQIDANFTLPPAYISYGKRDKGNLNIAVTNVTTSTNATLVFDERINELAGTDELTIPLTLTPGTDNSFSIPIKDGYEYEGHLFLNDTLTDEVYMADGSYSLDYDHTYTSISTYKPNNDATRVYADNEYPLYRDVTVKASSTDYVSVYKYITSGDDAVDLSAYSAFKFTASGAGQATVRLLKSSITNWNDQYKTTITLTPDAEQQIINLQDFTSSATPGTAFDASEGNCYRLLIRF